MKPVSTPWATLFLLAVNLAAAFAATLAPDSVAGWAFSAANPWGTSLLTHAFLHLNLVHLLGNLVVLAAVGPYVEQTLGGMRLLAVYGAGALVGALAHAGLTPSSAAPLVGASGAVAAILGYATIRFLGVRVPLAPGWNVPVGAVAVLWLVLQATGTFVRIGAQATTGGTAFWTHLGGFVAGIGVAALFRAPQQASLDQGQTSIHKMQDRGPGAVAGAAREHLARHPEDLAAWHQLAQAAADLHDVDTETQAWHAILERGPIGDYPMAVSRLAALHRLTDLPALQRLRLADRLSPAEAADLLRWSIVNQLPEDPARPDALLALADACLQADERHRLAVELAQGYPLHPATEHARTRGWLS